jgi:hypothetical protein
MLLVFGIVLVIGILIGWWLARRTHAGPAPPVCPAPAIPDTFDESTLATTLAVRLVGNDR